MSDVFISYSRRDKAFVQQLFQRLEQHGYDAWVDWDDIEYAEDWWRKICAGIEAADNFVFVMTPDSIRSDVCFDEIEFAASNNKRIIPVLRREIVEDTDHQRMHPALRSHNWLPLSEDDITDASIQILLETIAREPEHVQAHTRFLIRARDWERAAHNRSLLLRGDDLKQAENWLVAGVNKEPAPTQLHADYINNSRIAERRRQRSLFGGVLVALVISISLAILSFILFRQSEDRRAESDLRGTAVAEQAATATNALGEAEINLRQAWETQARLLADFSRQQLAAGNPQTALLLALESLAHAEDGVVNLENTSALRDALAYPGEALYMQHDDVVWGAEWNADASQILTYSADNTARVWDARSGDALFSLHHDDPVTSADWSGDGTEILTTSTDGTARLWNANDGENLFTLDHAGAVWGGVWFDEDRRVLTVENETIQEPDFNNEIAGQYQGRVHIWDAETGAELAVLEHANIVRFAWVSSDKTRILTSCDDGFARVWDAQTGAEVLRLRHNYAVWRAIYNPDETRILTFARELSATGETRDGSAITVWDAETGKEFYSLPYTGIAAYFPQWSQDGARIVTTSNNPDGAEGFVQVWDANSGGELLTLRHVATNNELNFAPPQAMWNADETRILSWAGDSIYVWDATTGDLIRTFQHEDTVRGAIWSKDEARILAWDNAGVIQVWDVGAQEILVTLRHDQAVTGARWSEDESAILSWSSDGTARLWNAANPAELLQLTYETPFGGGAWNTEGNQVASWSGATAAIYNPETGERLFSIEHNGETVHGVAWNRDDSRILSWGRDGFARLWDAVDGSEILELTHGDVVLSAAWNHDETQILTRTLGGTLHVWDIASATEVIPAISVQSGSGDAMWSPDDRYIASWSLDERALRLWDAQTGAEFQQIPTESSLLGAAWSPDSAHILYWTGNDMAHMWDVEAGNERLSLSHVTRRAELRADDNDISTGLWSADGSRILTSTVYGDVRIWDAETGVELKAIDECGGFVSWNADETLLLCARDLSANDGVSVWDVDTGEPILEYPLDIEGQFDGVAWSADDRRILAWTILDAKTFVWVADVQELVEIGQRRTYRALTDEERARFFLPPAS